MKARWRSHGPRDKSRGAPPRYSAGFKGAEVWTACRNPRHWRRDSWRPCRRSRTDCSQGVGVYFLKFSREYETEADILGAQIMARAGYDPMDLANMFQTIQQHGGGSSGGFMSSHPSPANRYARIQQEARLLRMRIQFGIRRTSLECRHVCVQWAERRAWKKLLAPEIGTQRAKTPATIRSATPRTC